MIDLPFGPLVAICIWALATMALAPLPIRYQILPGTLLLLALVPLMIWLAKVHGILAVLILCFAAVSLFRKPLRVLFLKLSRSFKEG